MLANSSTTGKGGWPEVCIRTRRSWAWWRTGSRWTHPTTASGPGKRAAAPRTGGIPSRESWCLQWQRTAVRSYYWWNAWHRKFLFIRKANWGRMRNSAQQQTDMSWFQNQLGNMKFGRRVCLEKTHKKVSGNQLSHFGLNWSLPGVLQIWTSMLKIQPSSQFNMRIMVSVSHLRRPTKKTQKAMHSKTREARYFHYFNFRNGSQ